MVLPDAAAGASTPYVYHAAAGDYAIEMLRGRASVQDRGGFLGPAAHPAGAVGLRREPGHAVVGAAGGVRGLRCGVRRGSQLLFLPGVPGQRERVAVSGELLARHRAAPGQRVGLGDGDRHGQRQPRGHLPGAWPRAPTGSGSGTSTPTQRTICPAGLRAAAADADADTHAHTALSAQRGRAPGTGPRGIAFERGQVYRFRLEGGGGSFPAIVRTGNRSAFRLTTGSQSSLDCSAGGQLDRVRQLQAVQLHVCASGVSSAIEVIKASDYSLLAQYPLYVAGETPPDARRGAGFGRKLRGAAGGPHRAEHPDQHVCATGPTWSVESI